MSRRSAEYTIFLALNLSADMTLFVHQEDPRTGIMRDTVKEKEAGLTVRL